MEQFLGIEAIAEKLNLPEALYARRSSVTAKLSLDLLLGVQGRFNAPGKLILVTAITPTVSGEGKTITLSGLMQRLERIGKRSIITWRESSLGPVFGMKGGAPGGANRRSSWRIRLASFSMATSTPSHRLITR